MSKRRPDDTWKAWVKENARRKANPELVLGAMIDALFTRASIEKEMGKRFPAASPLLKTFEQDPDYEALTRPTLTKPGNGLKVTRHDDNRLQLYTVENFLSETECDLACAAINTRLRPSRIGERKEDKAYRSSRTCDLGNLDLKIIDAIDEKIAQALGIRLPYSEQIQGQRYDMGQEYKEHPDYFAGLEHETYRKFTDKQGDRTWTFMVYLNSVEKGGGTRFTRIDKTIMPQKGHAVVWNNLDAEGVPNPFTLHAGLPIEAGHKMIVTKWFREKGIGPMFYD